jgi:2-(1,2-epoxy-1,2-dihydrophenyl)acetyl-CoA isomerase
METDAMGYETLDFEVRDRVGHLTLNRPKAANTLNLEMVRELLEVAQRCDEDAGVRSVLLTGAGPMFCAGGDLKSFTAAAEGIPAYVQKVADTLHRSLSILARMDAPIVAAVNGVAAGAGMSLACHADLAIAAESARFTMAYTAAGLTPDGSATWFLSRMIGRRRAVELMLTNRRLSAAEALEWNLVNRVVPDDELMTEAVKLARQLAAGPTRAYGGVKKLLIASACSDLETQMDLETKLIVDTAGSHDGAEGMYAFLEKRAPEFTGE